MKRFTVLELVLSVVTSLLVVIVIIQQFAMGDCYRENAFYRMEKKRYEILNNRYSK